MKICMISHDFYPYIGGIAAYVFNLSRALVEMGHEVLVLSIRRDLSLPSVERINGILVIRFLVPDINKIRGMVFILQAAPVLFILSLIKKFDVIHWHNMLPDTIVALFGFAKKKVFTNHSSGFLELFAKNPKNRFYSLLFHNTGIIIGTSHELTEKAEPFFNKKPGQTHYIPNGIDIDYFKQINQEEKENKREKFLLEHGYSSDFRIILCPRRLEPKNGVEFLIFAIPQIIFSFPNVLILIAGNDTVPQYADFVRESVKKLKLENYVKFLGTVPNKDMINLYCISDVVVLPSLMESTSIAGLEAMSCGIPLVGTMVGGIPEIIKDNVNGFIVPPRDPDSLVRSITYLLSDKDLQKKFGERGRKDAVEKFAWPVIVQKIIKIYE